MDLLLILRALFGLLVTLGLVGLAAYAGRRWGPAGLFQLKPAAERRMAIVESLSLSPTQRLVLVRVDAAERLILLGDGQMLGPIPGSPSPTAPRSVAGSPYADA